MNKVPPQLQTSTLPSLSSLLPILPLVLVPLLSLTLAYNGLAQEDIKDKTSNTPEASKNLSELHIVNNASFPVRDIIVEVCGEKRVCGTLLPGESRKVVFEATENSKYKITMFRDPVGGMTAALGNIIKGQKGNRTIEISDHLVRLLD